MKDKTSPNQRMMLDVHAIFFSDENIFPMIKMTLTVHTLGDERCRKKTNLAIFLIFLFW